MENSLTWANPIRKPIRNAIKNPTASPPYDSWRLEIPWLPPSLNKFIRYSHWSQRDALIQPAATILKPYLRVVLNDLGIPGAGPLPWKAEMTFQVFAKGRRDDDNCVVARKILLDCCKRLGFLADDDPTHVRSIDLPCEIDRQNPHTVITIRRFKSRFAS